MNESRLLANYLISRCLIGMELSSVFLKCCVCISGWFVPSEERVVTQSASRHSSRL